ncbi:MAG: alpha/beta fold hydrolase [Candidatus Krumholzibacteriaceae bacterium]|jgi:dienelactone hydrolase
MLVEKAPREIEIRTPGGRTIRADLRTRGARPETPVIIVCHGFLGYKRWGFFPYLSDRLAGAGFDVVTMSFSMNGVDESTGLFERPEDFARNTVSAEIEDLRSVCSFVRGRTRAREGAGGARWGLFGHSRGGAAAILVASEFSEARSIVTWSTLGRLDRYTPRRKAQWRRDGALVFTDARSSVPLKLAYSYYEDIDAHRRQFDLPRAAAALAIPHLMVHGERDAAVTLRETRTLIAGPRGAASRLEIVHGAGHTFNVRHPMRRPTAALERAARLTVEWFAQTLGVEREERS